MATDGSSTHEKARAAFRATEGDGPLLGHLYRNRTVGDEGVEVRGELHVGTRTAPNELVVGAGDSHTEGLRVWSDSTGAGAWTDQSDAAASASGSTYQTFGGGTAIGAVDYIGGDTPFPGVKLATAQVPVPGSGLTIAREYWNGSAWVDFKQCVVDADWPHEQRADNVGTVIGSEQLRFGPGLAGMPGWAQTSVNGVTKYWIRYRITGGSITTPGLVEQVKLHTSRWECNATGFTEYFGNGRYEKDIPGVHWGNRHTAIGLTPAARNITFSSNVGLVYSGNRLVHTTVDGIGGEFTIPKGLDTSQDVDVSVLWYPEDNTAGDVQLQFNAAQIRVGDTLDGSITDEQETTTETVAINTYQVLRKTTFMIDVQRTVPGEVVAFVLRRNTAGNTYSNGITLATLRATGVYWHP